MGLGSHLGVRCGSYGQELASDSANLGDRLVVRLRSALRSEAPRFLSTNAA